MKKNEKQDRYLGYSSGKQYFVAPMMGKEKFIKLVQANSKGFTSANWIRERISEGGNETALKHLADNPGMLLILDDSNLRSIIKKVKI